MNRIYAILMMALVCSPAALRAENAPSYLPDMVISDGCIVKKDRVVEFTMSVDLSGTKIRTQHTVALTPVLVSADGSREAAFAPMVIDGSARSKVYLRAQRLESVNLPPYHDGGAEVIIRRENGKEQSYAYSSALPYERWMLDGRVELREEVHGCVNCEEGNAEQMLIDGILPTYYPDYRLDTLEPEPEPVKMRVETRTARLQFRQDSYNIRPDYKNNRAELDTVENSIRLVMDNPDVEITGIYITGYASPEATEAYNLRLSRNRAEALAKYIGGIGTVSQELVHAEGRGEDWDGFIEALDKFDNLFGRDKVYELIEKHHDNHDAAELGFKNLKPSDIYLRLLNEVYPALRRNEYRIEYNVRNFDLEEARRMLDERPDLLSLSEIYKVAGSYGKGTAGYRKAMETALEYFPTSPAALNGNALDAISERDYARAVEMLENAEITPACPVLLNTLGVAYASEGEFDKAEEVLSRAAEAGLDSAVHNLGELRAVTDQL